MTEERLPGQVLGIHSSCQPYGYLARVKLDDHLSVDLALNLYFSFELEPAGSAFPFSEGRVFKSYSQKSQAFTASLHGSVISGSLTSRKPCTDSWNLNFSS